MKKLFTILFCFIAFVSIAQPPPAWQLADIINAWNPRIVPSNTNLDSTWSTLWRRGGNSASNNIQGNGLPFKYSIFIDSTTLGNGKLFQGSEGAHFIQVPNGNYLSNEDSTKSRIDLGSSIYPYFYTVGNYGLTNTGLFFCDSSKSFLQAHNDYSRLGCYDNDSIILNFGISRSVINLNDSGTFFNINNLQAGRFTYSSNPALSNRLGLNNNLPQAQLDINGYDATANYFGLKINDNAFNTNFYIRNDGAVNSRLGYWIDDARMFHSGTYFTDLYVGRRAGLSSISGTSNTGVGYDCLQGLVSGYQNTAVGSSVFTGIVNGQNNIGVGYLTGNSLVDGTHNIIFGIASEFATGSINSSFGVGSGVLITNSHQAIIGSEYYNFYFGENSVLPVNGVGNDISFNLSSVKAGNTFTDLVTGNWIYATGKSSGSAFGGNHIFKGSKSGISGNTINSLSTVLTIKSNGATKFEPISAIIASSIIAEDGDMIYVNSINLTFTSIGFWGYENGNWIKL